MRTFFESDFGFTFDRTTPILRYHKSSPFAFVPDGVGVRSPFFDPLLVATTDTVPGDTGTTETLTVDGAHVVSTIDTIGDQDFYAITLTAGTQYQIGMYGYIGGPGGLPLADSYVEIYDAAGNLVVSGDGGADTPLNAANSGFDVLLDFTPTASGTYYVNARAFDNAPADGSDGDLVGDYEVFVQTAPEGAYSPYYTPDSPLYAIDWGTRVNRVNQSAANPDGDEGTRNTRNAQGSPEVDAEIAALAAAQGVDIAGKNVITVYFARAGDVFTSIEDPASPGLPPATITAVGVQQFERDAVITSLGQFANVSDIVYLEVDNRDDADFVYTSYQGTPGPGVSLLGSMSPPDEPNEGLAQFNSGDERWNATNLQQGGFSFVTLIHEFGHGHGLAHPHDNGGRSGIMRGVEAEGAGVADYTTGDFALNQGVFTMMSYEDGWQSSPYGNAETDVGYGYLGGLMAFDIAAIQDKYGVNEEYATGDDTYTLSDVNAAGTFYSCIWDAAGIDEIVYAGARDSTIDLRAATLRYEAGGGGWMSYADGIYGGFTIANGATIENATGGSGDDTLVGNVAANALTCGAGDDIAAGYGGNDTLSGGAGNDALRGQIGDDRLTGGDDNDRLNGGDGLDTLLGDSGRDVLFGELGADRLMGGDGNDRIRGGDGDDRLFGGGGRDSLSGGTGNDRFIFETEADLGATLSSSDVIADFVRGDGDRISLGDLDAIAGTAENDAFTFIGGNAFSGTAGELRYSFDGGRTVVEMDVNGDSVADLFLRLDGEIDLVSRDFIF